MTSTTSSLSQSNTPSLQIIQGGVTVKGERRANLSDLKVGTIDASTNFSAGGGSFGTQEESTIGNVDGNKIQRQATVSLGPTAGGSFQYRGSSQTVSDNSQTTLNLANESAAQLRVMTVHSADPGGQGAVSALNPVTLAISSAAGTQASQVPPVSEVVDNSAAGAVAVTVDNADGTKYTYYPAVQNTDSAAPGQFYVMMSPQDMIPTVSGTNQQRIIAPRGHPITAMGESATFAVEADSIPVEFRKVETTTRSARDERRRATHNEVERKRRTKINAWIEKLACLVPECKQDQTKAGQSKGTTLSKAIDYIEKLRSQNDRLADTLKDHERLLVENQVLRQQMDELRRDNALLRANLHMHQEHQDMQSDAQQIDAGQ
ncbi:upstream stimulatory factor 2-like [Rhopilema esculentum]|uniref:upstream stimulatory factor 2-like n=1 Tax=Rhopilema esculentum TaxID=499914 RepID=UPI0031DCCC34|eukprot:gene16922-8410_t